MGGSGGNFHKYLMIDENGHVAPAGPLGVPPGEEMVALYAWVIQENADESGAVCIASEEGHRLRNPMEWTTRANPVHEGRFQPGPATGIAVAVSRTRDGATRVHWWSESFHLRGGGGGRIGDGGGGIWRGGGGDAGRVADRLEDANRSIADANRSIADANRSIAEVIRLLRGG
jgi:hypothetical protein